MTLIYKPAIIKGQNHSLIINDEPIISTKGKEVLLFARGRINSKYTWKLLKEAVRVGKSLEISGDN